MTIQKKSLISSLNTTKKAIVASTPAVPSVQLSKHLTKGGPASLSKHLTKGGPASLSKQLTKGIS